MKFKHFPTTGATGLEKDINEWLEGKDVKHVISISGITFGSGGGILPSIGIFYENPKSFTETVREVGK